MATMGFFLDLQIYLYTSDNEVFKREKGVGSGGKYENHAVHQI